MYVLKPKQDLYGLGYDPFKQAPEFRGMLLFGLGYSFWILFLCFMINWLFFVLEKKRQRMSMDGKIEPYGSLSKKGKLYMNIMI